MYSSTYNQHDTYPSLPSAGPASNARMFKIYGAILALMAAGTLALGISNVVMTKQAYCDPWTEDDPAYCSSTADPYIWTWVASGIWGSAPIFLAGIFSMCLSSDPGRWTRLFSLLIFLSAIIFAPAMIILSAIECWRGSAGKWNFYKMDSELMEGNILVEDSPYQAKFALPLVIAILAGIMFLMTGLITLMLCCCMQSIGVYWNNDMHAARTTQPIYQPNPGMVQPKEVYYPPRAQIRSQVDYQPTTGPYLATRYNSVLDPYNPGVQFGNFPARAFSSPTSCGPCQGQGPANFYDANPNFRYQ